MITTDTITAIAGTSATIVAVRLAQRPARGAMTFGLKRIEILSAQVDHEGVRYRDARAAAAVRPPALV